MKQKLCGSFIHFYACNHREARGGRSFKADCTPNSPSYRPGQPYRCGASDSIHETCPNADLDGSKHREAGIVIAPAKEAS